MGFGNRIRRIFGGFTGSDDRAGRLQHLESVLGHRFRDRNILSRATTHPSFLLNSDSRGESYERLEFLGDSILNIVVSEWLYDRYPDAQEGVLSQQRAHIISRRFLALASEAIDLPDCVQTGDDQNLLAGGGRRKIAADALEAIIGALYRDGGYRVARGFIERVILSRDIEHEGGFHTAKNRLQERIHEMGRGQLTYRTSRAQSAPDSDREDINFRCQVWLEGEALGSGWGRTKKEAEKEAALDALDRLAMMEASIPGRGSVRR